MGVYELDPGERDALYALIDLDAHCTHPGCTATAGPEEAVWHSGGPDAPPVADVYWKTPEYPGWQIHPEAALIRCPRHRLPQCSRCGTVWAEPLGDGTTTPGWTCMDCRTEGMES